MKFMESLSSFIEFFQNMTNAVQKKMHCCPCLSSEEQGWILGKLHDVELSLINKMTLLVKQAKLPDQKINFQQLYSDTASELTSKWKQKIYDKKLTTKAYGRLFAAYTLKKLGFKKWYKPLKNL